MRSTPKMQAFSGTPQRGTRNEKREMTVVFCENAKNRVIVFDT